MAARRFLNLIHKPFSLRSNIAANVAANIIIAAIFFVSVPLIVRLLGVEGYGLVGFFLFAQGLAAVLDLGLMTMLSREFAVLSGNDDEDGRGLHDLLRTSEIFYWSAAAISALAWISSSGTLTRFVNPNGINEDELYQSFVLMGLTLALQLPFGLYSGALYGLQRQAVVSGVGVVFSLLRNLGAVAVLHFVSATPQVFFICQFVCFALQVPILGVILRHALPPSQGRPSFRPELLTAKWKFVIGVGSITLGTLLLMQIDKYILARILPLEVFGYYAIAAVVANGLHWLTQPIFRAVLPRLSQLTAPSHHQTLSLLYHQSSQLLAIIVFPATALWAFFSYELLFIWQRDASIAANSSIFVKLLIIGGALNSVAYLPYALQLAFGWTRLQLAGIAGTLALSVPLTTFAALSWGGTGAAAVGVFLNATLIAFVVPAMHRRLLKGQALPWLYKDILPQMLAVALVGAAGRLLMIDTTLTLTIIQLGLILAAMIAAVTLSSSLAREWLLKRFNASHPRAAGR